MTSISAGEAGWIHRLRQVCLLLFAVLPTALLFSRGVADAIVAVIGLAFLVAVVQRRDWVALTHPMIVALIATWIILNGVVSPLAIDPDASYSRSLPWLRFIAFFAAISFWVVQTRLDVKVIVLAWSIILLGVVADGIVQLLFGMSLSGQPILSGRLTGPLDRPNIGIFAARIGVPLMAAWVWLAVTRQHDRAAYSKLAIFGFAAILVIFILLTGERAASLLTIIALAAVVTIVMFLLPQHRLHGLFGLAAVVGGVTTILLTSTRIMDRAKATIKVVDDLWGSIYGELIGAGLRLWLEHPLTGVGLKNYRTACEDLRTRIRISECNPHPHNIYVEWLSETGIVASLGFAAFVISFMLLLLKALSKKRRGRIAGAFLIGGAVVVLFPFTASQSFFSNWPAILLWSSLACTAAMARIIAADESAHP